MIIWGQGVILGEAEEEFKKFVEASGIPAVWTILGLSALSTKHPLNMGMVGMHGNYGPNILTNQCDVLIAVGMRFDDRVTGNLDTYAKQATVIHLEVDPAEVNKNVKAHYPVLGNCKESLPLLTSMVKHKEYKDWKQLFVDHMQIEFDAVIQGDTLPTKEGLTMGEVIVGINKYTKGDAVFVTDVGQHQMIACRYAEFIRSKSNVTSGGLGTMGFALPAAIGAKMGAPDREVVAVIGDGGYQMTIQELGTIFQNKTAVKIVVLNNDYLGMVRQWQQLFFDKRYASTEMIEANRVNKREDLDDAIRTMIASDEPYFLEVCVEKEDNVFPMIPTGASVSDIRLK